MLRHQGSTGAACDTVKLGIGKTETSQKEEWRPSEEMALLWGGTDQQLEHLVVGEASVVSL